MRTQNAFPAWIWEDKPEIHSSWKHDMRKRAILILVLLVLVTLVGACRAGGRPAQPDLAGTKWMLDSLNGNSLIADTEITLTFEETHLGGAMTCNQYGGGRDSGKYSATSDGTLAILQLAVTVQLCSSPEGVMEQEKAYIEALHNAATYRVIDDRLEISDANASVTLVYTRMEYDTSPNLESTDWVLTSLDGRGLIQGTRITLNFEKTYLGGEMTCNDYGGGPDRGEYSATDDGRLTISQLVVTAHLCSSPEGVMEQEKAYIETLTKAATYRVISGHQLEIAGASENVMLVYTRIEYGSIGGVG